MSKGAYIEEYDGYTRGGTSCYEKWLIIGSEHFHLAVGKRGLAVYFGPIRIDCGWDWEEQNPIYQGQPLRFYRHNHGWSFILWYRPYKYKQNFHWPRFIWAPHGWALDAGRLLVSYDRKHA